MNVTKIVTIMKDRIHVLATLASHLMTTCIVMVMVIELKLESVCVNYILH